MGKSTWASASSNPSRSRGSTVIDTETNSPSLPESRLAEGGHCQTLIIPPASGDVGLKKQKPWNFGKLTSKGQGQPTLTDRHAFSTFFSVVAISLGPVARIPKSFHVQVDGNTDGGKMQAEN